MQALISNLYSLPKPVLERARAFPTRRTDYSSGSVVKNSG
jgi:hypothetical protein